MEALMTLVPSATRTRVLLTRGKDTLLKAHLPPLSSLRHREAAKRLLEALSLWMDERLCVALYAAKPENCFEYDLTDELGVGARSLYYAVEVLGPRRPRGHRRSVDGPPADQLRLLAKPGGAL